MPASLLPKTEPEFQVGPARKLKADLVRLEASEDLDGIARLEATFINWARRSSGEQEPDYVYFEGDLDLGMPIAVTMGDPPEEVFRGKITAIHGLYAELRPPELMIRAEDDAMWLRTKQPSRLYEDATDDDIASEIASEAGLGADVGVDGPSHRAYPQLNVSDLAFLRERARAVDARVVIEDGKLSFKPRDEPAGGPIPQARMGEVLWLDVGADLTHQRTEVRVHGWSVEDKEAIHETASPGEMTPGAQGRTGPQMLERAGVEAPEDLHLETPVTREEAKQLAVAVGKRRARQFVTAQGTTRGTPALRARTQIELNDYGPWFSGVYLATSVRHTYDRVNGMRTHFVATRNWLGG